MQDIQSGNSFDQFTIKLEGCGRLTKRNRRFLRLKWFVMNDAAQNSSQHGTPCHLHPLPCLCLLIINLMQAILTLRFFFVHLQEMRHNLSIHSSLLSPPFFPIQPYDVERPFLLDSSPKLRRSTGKRRPALRLDTASSHGVISYINT